MALIGLLVECMGFLIQEWKVTLLVLSLVGTGYEGFHLSRAWDEKAALTAQAEKLKHDIDTVTKAQASDAERAKADADKIQKLEAAALATPKNAGPCLDRSATLRLRSIK